MKKIIKSSALLFLIVILYTVITNIPESTNAGLPQGNKLDSYSQKRTCGTMEYLELLYKQDPHYRKVLENFNEYAIDYTKKHEGEKNLALVTIPVVVHVVYNTAAQNISYDQIQSQINVLNRDFRRLNTDTGNTPIPFKPVSADPMVQFCLAQRDPNGNPSLGVTRTLTTVTTFGLDNAVKYNATGGHDAWDRDRYLNIWVCNLGGGLLGYATFPGGNPAVDGVVIGYLYFGTIGTATPPYHLGRTATHEIGHWLSLYHIWGDDNGACWGTDYCDDTPNQGPENYGCPSFPHITCNNGPDGDMFMNYMDYTDDGCMNIFTLNQSSRMTAALTGPRAPIQTSNGCVPASGVPIAMFRSDSTVIRFGGSIHFYDLSAGIPTSWNWTFDGGSPANSNIQNPVITYSTPGLYTVKLIVSNSHGTDSLTKVSYIRVLGAPLSLFSLVSPPNQTRITTSPNDPSIVNFSWTSSSSYSNVTYKFKIRKLGLQTDLPYPSNNNGHDTVISIRKSFLDTLANNFGVTGDSVRCVWRAWSYNGIDSLASSTAFIVTLVRGPIGIQNISSNVPKKFSLYNNYPNPFNPVTIIKFDVAKVQKVKIIIYDVLGRIVNVIVDQTLQPGTFKAEWNASSFSSGIYYFRMEAGDFSDTRKMVLVK